LQFDIALMLLLVSKTDLKAVFSNLFYLTNPPVHIVPLYSTVTLYHCSVKMILKLSQSKEKKKIIMSQFPI